MAARRRVAVLLTISAAILCAFYAVVHSLSAGQTTVHDRTGRNSRAWPLPRPLSRLALSLNSQNRILNVDPIHETQGPTVPPRPSPRTSYRTFSTSNGTRGHDSGIHHSQMSSRFLSAARPVQTHINWHAPSQTTIENNTQYQSLDVYLFTRVHACGISCSYLLRHQLQHAMYTLNISSANVLLEISPSSDAAAVKDLFVTAMACGLSRNAIRLADESVTPAQRLFDRLSETNRQLQHVWVVLANGNDLVDLGQRTAISVAREMAANRALVLSSLWHQHGTWQSNEETSVTLDTPIFLQYPCVRRQPSELGKLDKMQQRRVSMIRGDVGVTADFQDVFQSHSLCVVALLPSVLGSGGDRAKAEQVCRSRVTMTMDNDDTRLMNLGSVAHFPCSVGTRYGDTDAVECSMVYLADTPPRQSGQLHRRCVNEGPVDTGACALSFGAGRHAILVTGTCSEAQGIAAVIRTVSSYASEAIDILVVTTDGGCMLRELELHNGFATPWLDRSVPPLLRGQYAMRRRRIFVSELDVVELNGWSDKFAALHNVSHDGRAQLSRSDLFTPLNFVRFRVDKLFPPTVKLALYLDTDVMVRADVVPLFGGVATECSREHPQWAMAAASVELSPYVHQDAQRHRFFGFSDWLDRKRRPEFAARVTDAIRRYNRRPPKTKRGRDSLLNIGVTLFNLPRWRMDEMEERCMQWMDFLRHYEKQTFAQEPLNLATRGFQCLIDSTFNMQPGGVSFACLAHTSSGESQHPMANFQPVILHAKGPYKRHTNRSRDDQIRQQMPDDKCVEGVFQDAWDDALRLDST